MQWWLDRAGVGGGLREEKSAAGRVGQQPRGSTEVTEVFGEWGQRPDEL